MPQICYIEGERFERDRVDGYCQGCEDDLHEDGTPPMGVLVVGPIYQQISLVLCEACLRKVARVAVEVAGGETLADATSRPGYDRVELSSRPGVFAWRCRSCGHYTDDRSHDCGDSDGTDT